MKRYWEDLSINEKKTATLSILGFIICWFLFIFFDAYPDSLLNAGSVVGLILIVALGIGGILCLGIFLFHFMTVKEGTQKPFPIDELPLKVVRGVEEYIGGKIENLRDNYTKVWTRTGKRRKCSECGNWMGITGEMGHKFAVCRSCNILYIFSEERGT